MCYLAVQKDVYEQSRVKRPCYAYVMFMKDFIESKAQDHPSVRDAMRAGTLPDVRLLRSFETQTFSGDI